MIPFLPFLFVLTASFGLTPVQSQYGPFAWPDPYPARVTLKTKDTLLFTVSVGITNLRLDEVASDTPWFLSLWTDVRRAMKHYDIPEERRVMVLPRTTNPNSVSAYVQVGPAVWNSTRSSVDLFLDFLSLSQSAAFANATKYPVLSRWNSRLTYLLSYACENDEQPRASYTSCDPEPPINDDEDHRSGSSSKGPLVTAIIIISCIVGLGCFCFVCLRAAKMSRSLEESPPHTVELEPTPESATAVSLTPQPSMYNYPGSPNRLGADLPANVQPLKWGDDDDEKGDNPVTAALVVTGPTEETIRDDSGEHAFSSVGAATQRS